MSRHQAYRNYDYENDLDEFEGAGYSEDDDELSPEDRAQMVAGTTQVRAALGTDSSKVTTQQIEEALWHYYYDANKAAAYLASKYISPKPAKPPTQKNKSGDDRYAEHKPRPSLNQFFHDMPWLDIPNERRTLFIEPPCPPGGLLGGSAPPGKMSKLQALAAARKKKAEEQKSENRKLESQKTTSPPIPTALETPKEPTKRTSSALAERLSSRQDAKPLPIHTKTQTHLASDTTAEHLSTVTTQPHISDLPTTKDPSLDALIAAPSTLALTLFGSSTSRSAPVPRKQQCYELPYMRFLTSSNADPFSEPSPDDVVLAAQSKASNKKLAASAHKKKPIPDGKGEGLEDGIKTLRFDDTPLPKSKNLDVVGEFEKTKKKKNASFVVVGHVDAGKSTLMGRLLLDLGVVDQRTIQKYRKEAESIGKSSFALAWVLDQRSEERSRGVTIDIATNKFDTDSTSFTILDAPGHRDFIPNMIAGASQADFAILVVDATTGAFEAGLKGQTREHSLLLRSMGVSRIIVAINKLDTVSWSQERFDEISQQVSGFLSATGFQLKNVSFVPVSGLRGDNLVNTSSDPAASWYTGNTLIAELESSEPMARALTKPLRMTISEVFRSPQSPLTISGRIDAGSLQAGDAILVQPSGEKAYIKSLELDSEPVDWGVAGQNVVIHLSNIDPIHVRVGDIICDIKQPIACIDTFTIKVLAFDILMPMQVDVHRGRLHAAGQIVEISALLDKVKGTVLKKKPKIIKPAGVARIVVRMSSKVPLEVGQRVVLRSGGETVAAGLLE
ncbi:P-loop containing nucleoside triphosphate hydrolase protein [Xylaria flabelliformis]|nr:P-loop containing nucleoside triphosphate hydrolase protein [Xylaria flabelliformis]